jgi:hypothetical protein
VRDWVEVVGQNEQAYGWIRIVAQLMTTSVPRGLHGVLVADVRELKQEAMNLLVMMLDALNSDRCVVPFVVFGEMVQLPKNRLPDKAAGSP